MSSNIGNYVQQVNADATKMNDNMIEIMNAHTQHKSTSQFEENMNKTFDTMKKTLEEAISVTKNDTSIEGKKAYAAFQQALQDLTKNDPKVGAMMVNNAYKAKNDLQGLY